MPLILTTRLGVETRFFIRLRRSVPPASISVWPHSEPSRPNASFKVAAWAYSKASIALCLLLGECCQHLVRSERQRGHTHADSVGYGIGDGCPGRDYRRLPESNDAPLVISGSGHHVHNDFTDIVNSGQLVKLHVRVKAS